MYAYIGYHRTESSVTARCRVLRVHRGGFYVAVVIDLYSGKVVGRSSPIKGFKSLAMHECGFVEIMMSNEACAAEAIATTTRSANIYSQA